jgi:CRP-like cAMP-binding protein
METSSKSLFSESTDSYYYQVYKILKNTKFFQDQNLKDEEYKFLVETVEFEEIEMDEFVFHYGQFGSKFYIVLDGSVRILRPIKNKEMNTSNQKKGSIFGQTELKRKITRKLTKE